jgi:hypothetical protein
MSPREPKNISQNIGIFTEEKTGSQSIAVVGGESELILGGGGRQKLRPWTDVKGSDITDFAVYSTYADREAGEKLPLGLWRIRLAHYQPRGEIRLTFVEGGCDVDFLLSFETWGANVVAILPADSHWVYDSNGRMEREYLDGLSAALEQRKTAPHAPQPSN